MALPGKMRIKRLCFCVCLLVVLSTSCNVGSFELVNQNNANASAKSANADAAKSDVNPASTTKDDETLSYLDLHNPTLTQSVEPGKDEAEASKFVQVDVAEVVNPRKYFLSFDVHYQPKGGEKIYLGSFSLYPSDNPGKFIVATQGKVRGEGKVILSLVIPDKVEPGSQVKVGVRRIRFLKR